MKRFIISVLFVSVFFIGIGSIIEKTSAKFRSDAKAMEVIQRARLAIGGDSNLQGVRSMTITGQTTRLVETAETQDWKGGTLEINLMFPGQFSKMVKIGDPNAAGDGEVHKEVVVVTKDGDTSNVSSPDGPKKRIIVRTEGDGGVTEDIRGEGDTVYFTRKDGTTGMAPTDDAQKKRIRVHQDTDGSATWTTSDGDDVIIKKKVGHGGGSYGNEMLRTTMGLLLTAPEGADVSYKYLGRGDVDGSSCDIIEVSSDGGSFKLYIDAATSLPRMVSHAAGHKIRIFKKGEGTEVKTEKRVEFKEGTGEMPEHQLKFSDFRNVNGLLLPYRWTQFAGGKQVQVVDITGYDINPANIADKFKNRKVVVKN